MGMGVGGGVGVGVGVGVGMGNIYKYESFFHTSRMYGFMLSKSARYCASECTTLISNNGVLVGSFFLSRLTRPNSMTFYTVHFRYCYYITNYE